MQRVDLDSKYLEGTIQNGALRVVINRPERRNACTIEMYHGIKKAAVLADRDPEIDALLLTGVCARNENLNVDEVTEHIIASHEADAAMQIEPRELSDRIATGEKVYLLDVRTREEWEAVKLADSHLFTQELMQEILAKESRNDLFVIYDHKGARSMDAAAFFQGHGFENVKSLRGGIDAWSAEVDLKLARYHLE